jgi:hypothetical protein
LSETPRNIRSILSGSPYIGKVLPNQPDIRNSDLGYNRMLKIESGSFLMMTQRCKSLSGEDEPSNMFRYIV